MASRLNLQAELEELLGSKNVYFQPPASVQMRYDAIRYSLKDIDKINANDKAYRLMNAYELILIYRDPDSDLPNKIVSLPMCSFDRHYVADNLNHAVFTIYY